MYISRSRIRFNILRGDLSVSTSSSSRKVRGNPTLIVISMFPERKEPKGNWNTAIIRTSIKIPTKIEPNFFVELIVWELFFL